MPVKRRGKISLRGSAFLISRLALKHDRFVYVFVANRPRRYHHGNSRIVYIGTTRKGLRRLADSLFDRSGSIFGWGVHSFEAFLLTCRPRQRVKTWIHLERAMLCAFKEKFGELPSANAAVDKLTERNCFDFFSRTRVNELIGILSERSLARAARK